MTVRKMMIVLVVLAVTAVNAWMNWYLWQGKQRPGTVVQPTIERDGKPRQLGQRKIFRPQRQPIKTARPPWLLLESDDYHQYAANLRSIGCPEKTVRDILVADIGANFKAQREKIWDESESEYWITGDQQEELKRQRNRSEAELFRAKWALLRDLFGYPVDEEALRQMRGQGFGQGGIWLVFGFLEREQATRILASTHDHERQASWLNRLAEGILLPEDYAQVAVIRESLESEFVSLIGPDAVEEVFLRLAMLKGLGQESIGVVGMNFSADEFRNIVRIKQAGQDLLASLFISEGFTDLKEELASEAEVEEAIARYLGADRYADYSRAKDDRYQNLYRFATDKGLSKKEAAQVFDLRAELDEELKSLQEAELEVEERLGLQLAIKIRMERHIDKTFGKVIGQEYRESGDGEWLREMIPGLEAAPKAEVAK